MNKQYIVIKRVNNNTVFANGPDNKEVILMGKGIGFQVYPRDLVNCNRIERIFKIAEDSSEQNKIIQMVESLSEDILLLSKDVIDQIEIEFNTRFNTILIFNLADHLEFAIEREEKNIELKNPLEQEIKLLYPNEYKMATKALFLLNESLNVNINENEISYIAMHFVNSGDLFINEMHETVIVTKMIADIMDLIEQKLGYELDSSSIDFMRLTTHLRFFIIRQLRSQHLVDNLLDNFDNFALNFEKEYEISEEIIRYLSENYDWKISNDEKMYLTIHLMRVTRKGE